MNIKESTTNWVIEKLSTMYNIARWNEEWNGRRKMIETIEIYNQWFLKWKKQNKYTIFDCNLGEIRPK